VSPPLDLLVETARSIIQDGILWPEMSNFIDVTSQIELYRARAVELGRNILAHFGSDGRMPGRQVPYALDDQSHKELRSRYLSMIMFVRRAVSKLFVVCPEVLIAFMPLMCRSLCADSASSK
jgi:hypothetical protein